MACSVDHDSTKREARKIDNCGLVDGHAAIHQLTQGLNAMQGSKHTVGNNLDAGCLHHREEWNKCNYQVKQGNIQRQ